MSMVSRDQRSLRTGTNNSTHRSNEKRGVVSAVRRKGLRPVPPGGWPLDDVFVGVATLRTMRELFLQAPPADGRSVRAWDLALWSGVSVQGSADALRRLVRAGLAEGLVSDPGHADRFRPADHPLVDPIARLFGAEYEVCRRISREWRDRPFSSTQIMLVVRHAHRARALRNRRASCMKRTT